MRIKKIAYDVETSKKVNNFSIIHLSDIHFCDDYNINRLDMILRAVQKAKPNYVCITGDLMDTYDFGNKKENSDIFLTWLEQLGEVCPVIVIIGNHDIEVRHHHWKEPDNLLIKGLKSLKNVHFLMNESYDDGNICFMGYNPPTSYYDDKESDYDLLYNDFRKKFLNISRHRYNILLMHTPIGILESNLINYVKSIDLILTGHTHGGLLPLWLPGNWGIISPFKRLFPKNVRGIIYKNNTVIVINSGIIKLSNSSGILKYFNDLFTMDIVEIRVKKKKKVL